MSNSPAATAAQKSKEVTRALRGRFSLFMGVGIFSGIINLLALTGSMYMLQVYDRVIPSRSLPTLIGLTMLMLGLYLANGFLDILRGRIMSRIGLRFDKTLREKVFDIVLLLPLKMRPGGDGMQPVRDLDQIRSFLATPGPIALFDMPWMPVFIGIIYLLHPWLGMLAIGGGLILLTMAISTELMSRKRVRAAAGSGSARHLFAESARRNAEVIRAMGMGGRIKTVWLEHSRRHLLEQRSATDVVGGFGSISKIVRMILQSAMLGLGAYLVILGEASAGVMIAGSILMSRALSPIEIAIANSRGFIAARHSYHRLKQLFAAMPTYDDVMQLPPPTKSLVVDKLWVAAPGSNAPIVQNVSFALQAGAGLGIIGRSASGKSSLARALVGVWSPVPQRGYVRLDGAALDQWAPDELGQYIGYLPQDIELFDGTIAQNIARFDPMMTSEAIIKAANDAGVHEMILHLSQGYDTHIGEGGMALSAGQRQRIGLARALYKDPFLVVLDEPNSNLDAHGDQALAGAITNIRSRGGIAIVIAHRPSVLAGLDDLLAMANGQAQAFGPKDEVLAKVTQRPQTGAAQRPGGPQSSPQTPAPVQRSATGNSPQRPLEQHRPNPANAQNGTGEKLAPVAAKVPSPAPQATTRPDPGSRLQNPGAKLHPQEFFTTPVSASTPSQSARPTKVANEPSPPASNIAKPAVTGTNNDLTFNIGAPLQVPSTPQSTENSTAPAQRKPVEGS